MATELLGTTSPIHVPPFETVALSLDFTSASLLAVIVDGTTWTPRKQAAAAALVEREGRDIGAGPGSGTIRSALRLALFPDQKFRYGALDPYKNEVRAVLQKEETA